MALTNAATAQELHSPLLAALGITKRFGSFTANDNVSLELNPGEVHALLGENGAGKSTLVKMLYGLLAPTDGEILWQGAPITLANPNAARALGIGMVFQHFSLFDNLTVAENIALVMPPGIRLDEVPDRIDEISRAYGMGLEPSRPVWSLSAGERQRIEIARCLLQDPKVLILDEPTSVLTPQEAEKLFETLDRLKAERRALLYISHHLEEVKRLCDRATILRLGKVVGTCDPRVETPRSLAALMVGSQIMEVRAAGAHAVGKERLVVSGLDAPSPSLHGVSLKRVSLAVRGGEVFGVAGVAGNGQSELFANLSGESLAPRPEAIAIDGTPVGALGISERRALHAGFVPEERNGHAAAPDFTLSENIVLTGHGSDGLTQMGFINGAAAKAQSQKVIAAFDVRKSGADPLGAHLVGRQFAEIRGRAGNPARAGAAGHQSADLGRGCAGVGDDPAGADRSFGARRRRADHQPGPRRTVRDQRSHRGHSHRRIVRSAAGAQHDARGDRSADGRRKGFGGRGWPCALIWWRAPNARRCAKSWRPSGR